MYAVEAGSPITLTGSDGIPATVITTKDLTFKRQHMRYRPLKSERLMGTFTFVWNTLTICVSGQYVLEDFKDEPYHGCYAQSGFGGRRPRRHYFRLFIRKC